MSFGIRCCGQHPINKKNVMDIYAKYVSRKDVNMNGWEKREILLYTI